MRKWFCLIPIYPHHISTSLRKWQEKEKLDLPLCFILYFLSKVCINCYETPFHYCIFHQQNKCLHLYMCLCKIYSLPLFSWKHYPWTPCVHISLWQNTFFVGLSYVDGFLVVIFVFWLLSLSQDPVGSTSLVVKLLWGYRNINVFPGIPRSVN